MSNATQCPSTVGKKTPGALGKATGRAYWRSLDELAQTEQFVEFAEREFPALASELTGESRRQFLKVMGASLALAGAATIPGCRRPDHKILPFTRQPEDIIEGKPTFYASARPLPGGGAEGVLVETYSGRPTKIEGNPLHPESLGKSSLRGQASVLELYDTERLTTPSTLGADGERVPATWDEFDRAMAPVMAAHDADGGAGLYFVVDKTTSPTRDRVRDRVMQRWPRASWLPYEAIDRENEMAGTAMAFGAPMRTRLNLQPAAVIVSLDSDFLAGEDATLPIQRGFAAGRRVVDTHSGMNRLYAVESGLTTTGMAADHRLRLRPSAIASYAAALAQAVLAKTGGSSPVLAALSQQDYSAALKGVDPKWIEEVAKDLVGRGAHALVVAGENQPPVVHALAAAMNTALGAAGRTVTYQPLTGDTAARSSESLATLAGALARGEVRTLVCLEKNPLFDAPASLRDTLRESWGAVPNSVYLSTDGSETALASAWSVNAATWLEAWGDVTALDGTLSPVQPMIKPLYGGRSSIELLAGLVGGMPTAGYELVRDTWRQSPGRGTDRAWRRALHDGLVAGSASPAPAAPALDAGAIAAGIGSIGAPAGGIEAVFVADTRLFDGRYANNGWLQELPDAVSKITWDNPVLMSAATAESLGLKGWLGRIGEQKAPIARVTIDGRALEAPVWRVPGMADDTIVVTLGNGRTSSGLVGTGAGTDTYAVRPAGASRIAAGVSIEPTGRTMPIACTQDHGTMVAMEGDKPRAILREFDYQAYQKHGDTKTVRADSYGHTRDLNPAQMLGTESHAPVNEMIYQEDQRHSYDTGQQWGMSIDLNTCIACGVCTVACQAENNIPVVGKREVNRGREMHWIRVDRYFSGDADGDVQASSMPLGCVHCENAPCETVCPVNATVHSPNGLNVMAYNRCIGTRYCSNNCPYKVRRFNFFDYGTKRLGGDNPLKGIVSNEAMVPPRLREVNPEVHSMLNNPNVTVRERGVMEKCTYCIQRINETRIDEVLVQKKDRIADGVLQTACQQACPTDAIVFGDINDPSSRVVAAKSTTRTYALLDYLNTTPRTTFQARLRNPNPALREPVLNPFHHGGHGGHDEHGGENHGGGHDAADSHDEHARRHEPGHIMSLSVLPTGALRTGGRA